MNVLGEAIRKAVKAHRQRPAYVLGDDQSTYGAIFKGAERNAEEILGRKKTAGTVMITATYPSHLLKAMVGAVLADTPFICLTKDLPEASLAALRHDAGVCLILGQEGMQTVEQTGDPLPREVCCVVSTSGSTGRPLGVMHRYSSVLNNAENYGKTAQITPDDRLTWLTSPMFAAAHSAIWGALLHGATLLPFEVKTHGLTALDAWLNDSRATIYHSVPTLFRAWLRAVPNMPVPAGLRLIRLGGEPVTGADVQLFRSQFAPSCQLLNSLGLSENGGTLAFHTVDPTETTDGLLPVGQVAEGYEIILQNELGMPDAAGEIVVRSPHLALGYAGQPERTAERFQPDGLHTGDWGSWDAQGRLIHHGRRDRQVKIRGHRVHLNLVENALLALPEVTEAAVLASEEGRLVAWVVADFGSSASLRANLKLADWEIPAQFVFCESLPRTPNGKIDRLHLPKIPEADGILPRTSLETWLTNLWAQVLDLPESDVYTDFFQEGGHSLAAMELVASMNRKGYENFMVDEIRQAATPAEMAAYLQIRQPQIEIDEPHLATFRSCQMGRPLLFVPGGLTRETELFVYASLLPHLPKERPVWGVRAHYFSEGRSKYRDRNGLIARIVHEWREVLAGRSYDLVTDCVGVNLAWEIACVLANEGNPPRHFAAMDSQFLDRGETLRQLHLKMTDQLDDPQNKPLEFFEYAALLSENPLSVYAGKVDFIWSTARLPDENQRAFWSRVAVGEKNEHAVIGNHQTYIREHRRELGAVLTKILTDQR